ncbi:MAG: hypothetical protein ABI860_08840 [Gemmatimonadales bacterium]
MKTSIVAGSLLAALTVVAPLHGQRVAADVVVRGGPVAGHVVVGDGYSTYRRPVVYRRAPARVIVVERVHSRHHRHAHQWRRHGYRPVTLYYSGGRYYDRYVDGGPAVREVVIYERQGRFYRECDDDDRDWNDRRDDRHQDRDRYDRSWDD